MQRKSLISLAVCFLFISIIIGGCTDMQNKTATITPKYPTKPIIIVAPFGAGGAFDLIARALEKTAPQYLGQPLVIVNKPGGAGAIGWNELASASPDGYTLGITGVELITLPLYGPTKYHYPTALEPLAQVSTASFILIVKSEQPWQDVASLIKYSKQNPGQLKFGHSGIGSLPHVVGETFAKNADITLEQVPFRSASEVTAALLGKHIEIAFVNQFSAREHIKNGTIRALAVASEQRLSDPVLAQIPTFKEQGLNIVFNNWYGVAAPKGLPPEVKTQLSEGFKRIISDPEFKNNIEQLGLQIKYLDSKESEAKWLDDSAELTKIVQGTGILDRIKAQKN